MYTYNYWVSNVRVIDGDSFEALVDLGFYITLKEKFRLFGVDTPEISGEERPQGLISKEFSQKFFSNSEKYKIVVHGKDKYGRWLCSVFDGTVCLNEELINSNLAKEYFGGVR